LASARCCAAGLVGLVEQRLHFRIVAQHGLVEVAGQGFAALFQNGTVAVMMALCSVLSMMISSLSSFDVKKYII
jgi:hypothetical protein